MRRPYVFLLAVVSIVNLAAFAWSRIAWPSPSAIPPEAVLSALAAAPAIGRDLAGPASRDAASAAVTNGELRVLRSFYAAEVEREKRLSLIGTVLLVTVMADFFAVIWVLAWGQTGPVRSGGGEEEQMRGAQGNG